MSTIKIYGGSDDLVEISGDLSEEFNVITGPTYLLFNDGTQIKITYDNDGVWRAGPVTTGEAEWDKSLGLPDGAPAKQCHGDPDAPSYSDVITLTWDKPFKLVKRGRAKLSPPPPQLVAGKVLADKVIDYLNGRGGFDEWWHDIGNDEQNEIVDGLSKILSPKAAPGTCATISGNVFVITGTLSIPREQAIKHIEANGGEVASSVSGRVNYLICGTEPGSKVDKARELGITILSESEFLTMLPS